MSDAFKAMLAKREAEQQAQSGGQKWLLIIGVLVLLGLGVFVFLRGDPSKRILNPNTASEAELVTLPDVGPVMAKAIIAKRQGKTFAKPEDLLDVKGIGPKTLEKMKPRLKFE